jgi:hypothetical protein
MRSDTNWTGLRILCDPEGSRDCLGSKQTGICDGEINAMVEGSKFRESHVLKILSWRAKKGGMPRPLVVRCPDL